MVIYGLCFIVGGIFVLLAAVGGLDGAHIAGDFDVDAHLPDHIDIHFPDHVDDIDAGTQIDQTLTALRSRWWLPFLSLRFWTFALCFFGLTGLLLQLVQPRPPGWLGALIAVLMGFFCGLVAALVLRALGRQSVSSLIRPEDLTGQIGTVEIPFDAHSRGKVYLSLSGSRVSFLAMTQEEREFQRGDSVLVVGLERDKLWVAAAEGVME
ncbi:OB-fold-containig protein [Nodosilinea nodulosa]|uniref:OB-fold-containig protein n=1 Tax=Nodosilinea nodulosa TaxID=416001 RepID=UPI0002E3BDD5|nr:OB-fold-containig protein [Nodosilinea nodulosa]